MFNLNLDYYHPSNLIHQKNYCYKSQRLIDNFLIHFRKAMLDIAIPQDTGFPVNGTGTAIEMCRDCPKGYEGYSCEECSQVIFIFFILLDLYPRKVLLFHTLLNFYKRI